jgi:hypothetical protein
MSRRGRGARPRQSSALRAELLRRLAGEERPLPLPGWAIPLVETEPEKLLEGVHTVYVTVPRPEPVLQSQTEPGETAFKGRIVGGVLITVPRPGDRLERGGKNQGR